MLPRQFNIPPRKGEQVAVVKVFHSHFNNKHLPLSLEVVDVTWTELGVVCELHYREIDLKAMAQNPQAKPYG